MEILFFMLIFLNLNFKTILTTPQNEEQPTLSTRTENIGEIANSHQEDIFDDLDLDLELELSPTDVAFIHNYIYGNEQQREHGEQVNNGVPANKVNGIIKHLIPNEKMLQTKVNKKNQLFEKTLQKAYIQSILANKKNANSSNGKKSRGKSTAGKTISELLHLKTESLNKKHKQLENKMTKIYKQIHVFQGKLYLQKHLAVEEQNMFEFLIQEKDKIEAEIKEIEEERNKNELIMQAKVREDQDVQKLQTNPSAAEVVKKVDSKNFDEILEKFQQKHSLPYSTSFSREKGKRRKLSELSESRFQTVQLENNEEQSRNGNFETRFHMQFNIFFMEKHLKLLQNILKLKRDQFVPLMEELFKRNNQITKFHADPSKRKELEELKRQYTEKSAKLTQLMEDVKLYESHIEYVENKMKSEKESLKN